MSDHIGKPSTGEKRTAATPDDTPARTPSLDPQVIGRMRKTHASMLMRLVTTYADHAPKAVSDLDKALAALSIDALRTTAHSLKSSSANIGASRLSAMCRELEARLKTATEWDGAANLAAVDAIKSEYNDVAAELAALQLDLAAAVPASSATPAADGKASA